jgi:hypothetical protein
VATAVIKILGGALADCGKLRVIASLLLGALELPAAGDATDRGVLTAMTTPGVNPKGAPRLPGPYDAIDA